VRRWRRAYPFYSEIADTLGVLAFPCRNRAAPTAFHRAIGRQAARVRNKAKKLGIRVWKFGKPAPAEERVKKYENPVIPGRGRSPRTRNP
jgi:hypothetical protein